MKQRSQWEFLGDFNHDGDVTCIQPTTNLSDKWHKFNRDVGRFLGVQYSV